MLKNSDIVADLHTHTVFSKHAYSTLKENIDCAHTNKLSCLAVTDHYYQPDDFFERKNEVVRMAYVSKAASSANFSVISGGEFNLGQPLATDIEVDKIYKNVKWRLAGLHTWFVDIPNQDIRDIPVLFEQMIKDGSFVTPTAFAHIEREIYKCLGADDANKIRDTLFDIVDLAVSNNIFLEINESSIISNEHGGVDRMKCWLQRAKEKNAMLCMGTDAHFCEAVGVFNNSIKLINSIGISSQRILNVDKVLLNNFV